MENAEYIELAEHRAVMCLPENAVEVTMTAKVYTDGDLQTVSMTYDMAQIREMFRKADEGYIDEGDKFYITEKGLACLEEMEHERE